MEGRENVVRTLWMNENTYVSNRKIPKEVIFLKYDPEIDRIYKGYDWRVKRNGACTNYASSINSY